ncbi:MAG TPA: FAD:protein FMN transferase [Streptosporangiaceae bacterium]
MTGRSAPSGGATTGGWTALGAPVQLVVTDPARLEKGRAMLTAGLAAADASCNAQRPDSELAALNRQQDPDPASTDSTPEGPALAPVQLSPLLADAIAVALRTARLTGGDVDPTLEATADPAAGASDTSRPTAPSLAALLGPAPRWHQVHLDPKTRLLRRPAGLRLDLGATARAWAADRCAASLASTLGCGVLVGIGGDIAVAGQVPRGGWRIRVQEATGHPEEPPRGRFTLVAIRDGGLATASTAARRRRSGADLLQYISDPRTGLPAAPFWRTVSVAAASCTAANAAAATAMIRGRHAPEWLAGLRLPARLVTLDGRVRTVSGWPATP